MVAGPAVVPLAAAGGSTIFLIFLVAMIFIIAGGYYTRKGSGINQRPVGGGRSDAPGVGAGPSHLSAAEAPERQVRVPDPE